MDALVKIGERAFQSLESCIRGLLGAVQAFLNAQHGAFHGLQSARDIAFNRLHAAIDFINLGEFGGDRGFHGRHAL